MADDGLLEPCLVFNGSIRFAGMLETRVLSPGCTRDLRHTELQPSASHRRPNRPSGLADEHDATKEPFAAKDWKSPRTLSNRLNCFDRYDR